MRGAGLVLALPWLAMGCGESFAAVADDGGASAGGGLPGVGGSGWGGDAASGGAGSGGSAGTGGGGAGGAGLAPSGGGAAGARLEACPSGPKGAELVLLPGGAACIDRVEVTRGSYEDFRAAPGAHGASISGCAWNADLAPTEYSMASRPVVGIDWCDAAAYCAWAGKRLCAPAERSAPCAGSYPYGDVYDPARCATQDLDGTPGLQATDTLRPAGTATCSAGEVLDLSGNVAEWADDCAGAGGEEDACGAWGGGYRDDAAGATCASRRGLQRGTTADDVGLRCCWSP